MDNKRPLSPSAANYRFGDRLIASSLRLVELPCVTDGFSGELIRIDAVSQADEVGGEHGWLQRWDDDDGDVAMALARIGDRYLLRFARICDFELDFCGPSIKVRMLADGSGATADENTIEHLLVDQVLPRFMAQQGELLIHASALTFAGRTALFLGESGWGKSTLAGLLHRAGHDLLSDDCVQLKQADGHYLALPTYPSLRLFDDSLDGAFPGSTGSTAVAAYSKKRRLPVATAAPGVVTAPVVALYLLDEPSEAITQTTIAGMRPVSACLELMRHAFKLEIGDRARTQRLFAACSDVARAIPAFSLDYPRDYAQSEALVNTIARHLAALPDIGAGTRADLETEHARG